MRQGQNRGNDPRNNSKNNRNNNRNFVDTEAKNHKVETPEVNGIISLRVGKITKKLTFDKFREKLSTYINRELSHATDVVCVVKHMMDKKK